MGFRISGSLYPAIRTTWLLTLAMAGTPLAEHTIFHRTHNRVCKFPDTLLKPGCLRLPFSQLPTFGSCADFTVTIYRLPGLTAGGCTRGDLHSFAFHPLKRYKLSCNEKPSGSLLAFAQDDGAFAPSLFDPLQTRLRFF